MNFAARSLFISLACIAAEAQAGPLQVDIRPVGLSEQEAETLTRITLEEPRVKSTLRGGRFRVLSAEYADGGHYLLKVYSYDLGRLFEITETSITTSTETPRASNEEFQDALDVLARDAHFGAGLARSEWSAYRAMPGVLDSASERIITVGLSPNTRGALHEVVGVNLNRGVVIRYPAGAPPTSRAERATCGYNNARQPTTPDGTPGTAEIVVSRDGREIWRLRVTRPSASSGRWGSAIDLRDVRYRGNTVLKQAHVPILNVLYDRNACGPYRDWQDEENSFQATGTLEAPGILRATARPTTILDTGDDLGNFRGVAIHTSGTVTRLVTELAAGWYRYVAEFNLHEDGTIEPRFGFSGVKNSCVCRRHHHHAYWRLDFQLGAQGLDRAEVSADGGTWSPIAQESKFRKSADNRLWRIYDPASRTGYLVTPGADDGTADAYGKGDVWVLRAKAAEIEDSRVYTGTSANLDAFVNSESVTDQDLVLWYGGHFIHDQEQETSPRHTHTVGPRLSPINLTN